jgi:uncharacterized protein DUF4236
MPFRFRRSISIVPGLKINFGATGASLSLGTKGAEVTLGQKGATVTAGIPGSGLSMSQHVSGLKHPTALPDDLRALAKQRPSNWEFPFLQRALASRIDQINALWQKATTTGMDEFSFSQWVGAHLDQLHEDLPTLQRLLTTDLAAALGPPGKPGSPEKLMEVVEGLTELMEALIGWEELVTLFAENPLFRPVAETMSGMSRPFLDCINELQRRLDTQIPDLPRTHHIDLAMKMPALPNAEFFGAAMQKFADEFVAKQESSADQPEPLPRALLIARCDKQLGRFSIRTIEENLANNIFSPQDWYWSESSEEWRTLESLQPRLAMR